MSSIELKPCPFCGRTDTLIIHEVSQQLDDTDIKQYTVYYKIHDCPFCEESVYVAEGEFCPSCGQALDWSDSND